MPRANSFYHNLVSRAGQNLDPVAALLSASNQLACAASHEIGGMARYETLRRQCEKAESAVAKMRSTSLSGLEARLALLDQLLAEEDLSEQVKALAAAALADVRALQH